MTTIPDPAHFRAILGHYPTGVCVITSIDEDGSPIGMNVGTFTSVSLSPPLVAFFPDRGSETWPRIQRSGRFCVNVLAEDQEDVCQCFARRGADKFLNVSHRKSDAGLPIIDDVIAWIDCTLNAVHDAGDHLIVLGEVHALDARSDHRPLLFFQSRYERLRSATARPAAG